MKIIPYGHQCIQREDIEEVVKVLRGDWITQGPAITRFEESLCKYTGAKYAVVVSSGTAALHIAALAAGIGDGDEVITTPNTFVASANCVLYCGGKPVFVDIEADTLNIDPAQVSSKINSMTKALIPVHFSGLPCKMKELSYIAKKHRLIIIEDACHALGAKYKLGGKWHKIGSCTHSDMAVFSFHPVKSITTGEGGAVMTNDIKLRDRLLMLRTHGITKDPILFFADKAVEKGSWYYEMQELGFNYRITDIQAALGVSQMKRLDAFIKVRTDIARCYIKAFSDLPGVIPPFSRDDLRSAWHLYLLRIKPGIPGVKQRGELFNSLRKLGIGAQVHYIPVHFHPFYSKRFGYKSGDFPVTEEFYRNTLSLPIYPSMTDKDVKKVISSVRRCFHAK